MAANIQLSQHFQEEREVAVEEIREEREKLDALEELDGLIEEAREVDSIHSANSDLASEPETGKRKGAVVSTRSILSSTLPSTRPRGPQITFPFLFQSCKHASRAKATIIARSKCSKHFVTEVGALSNSSLATFESTTPMLSQDSSATNTNSQPRSAETTSKTTVRTPRRRTRRNTSRKGRFEACLPSMTPVNSTNTPSWLKVVEPCMVNVVPTRTTNSQYGI